MDIFKQIPDAADELENEFGLLTTILQVNGITVVDLLNSMQSDGGLQQLPKRLGRSIKEIEKYAHDLKLLCRNSTRKDNLRDSISMNSKEWLLSIPTGFEHLDKTMRGGIPKGHITEIFGQSGTGKTQFLMHMALRCQSVGSRCVYISTESPIETKRLIQMIDGDSSGNECPTLLENMICMYCQDYETLDHALYTQLPVLLRSETKIDMIIIDSIAHHLRRDEALTSTSYLRNQIEEQEKILSDSSCYAGLKPKLDRQMNTFFRSAPKYQRRIDKSLYLLHLYRHLSHTARKRKIAIIISNQVSDYADDSSIEINPALSDPLDLSNQIGYYAGWDNITVFNNQKPSERKGCILLDRGHVSRNLSRQHLHGYSNFANEQPMASNEADSIFSSSKKHYKEYQRHLMEELHSLKNHETKKHVPALGYHWSAFITCRLLFIKTYQPQIIPPNDTTNESNSAAIISNNSQHQMTTPLQTKKRNDDVNYRGNDSATFNNACLNPASLVSGWKAQRYIKIVSTPFDCIQRNDSYSSFRNKIQFLIDGSGLQQI